MKKIITLLAVAIAGGVVAVVITKSFSNEQKNQFERMHLSHFVNLPEASSTQDFVTVSELVTPTVVHILTRYEPRQEDMSQFDPFGFFHGFKMPQGPQSGSGSGVIMTSDGYIVTNNHVVENATKVRVVLNDKREYDATIIGTDPNTDLALLRIDEKNLPFAVIGNSDDVKVGQWVLAVGNPFNLTSTITAGIVSAKGRNLNLLRSPNNAGSQYSIESFIQTDAAVNPGNSGGALVSAIDGKLIGINTAIASQTGQYAGYSFAVPSNLMKKIIDDLLKYGNVQRGLLGVTIQDVTADLADKEGLANVRGVFINGVGEKSSADEAGLKEKDVIIMIDDVNVNNVPELQEQIGKRSPGDKVKITYLRNGKERETAAILRGKDGKTSVELVERTETNKALGAELESITRDERLNLKIQSGVRVARLDDKSLLRKAGIPVGFIITAIDKKTIATVAEAKKLLESKKGGVLIEGIKPDGSKGYYGFGIE
jgi:serine protease Do